MVCELSASIWSNPDILVWTDSDYPSATHVKPPSARSYDVLPVSAMEDPASSFTSAVEVTQKGVDHLFCDATNPLLP